MFPYHAENFMRCDTFLKIVPNDTYTKHATEFVLLLYTTVSYLL